MTQQFKEALINEGFSDPESFKGCTDEEIQQVMQAQNVKRLPEQFIEYLEVMGHGGISEIFISDDADYHSMLVLKASLNDEVEFYNHSFSLPKDAFVFSGHQNVLFGYFLTDNNDDNPSVFQFGSEQEDAQMMNNTLTDYFEDKIIACRSSKRER